MAIATNQPDGWPQATLVGYVNDGLFSIALSLAIRRNMPMSCATPRVSVAIGRDAARPLAYQGLSFAAKGRRHRPERDRYNSELRLKRYSCAAERVN